MTRPAPRKRRGLAAGLVLVALLAGSSYPFGGGGVLHPAEAGGAGAAEATPQTDDSLPATDVTMIGSSPEEAPGETWGVGEAQGGSGAGPGQLVRYSKESGWSLGPGFEAAGGGALQDFKLDQPRSLQEPSPLAGSITPSGSGALLGTVPGTVNGCGLQHAEQTLLVRNPGGAFKQVPTPGETLLASGECLFAQQREPILAALDEGHGRAGALVVPVDEAANAETKVLHWDGGRWTREQIAVPEASSEDFHVLAIGASSPKNAWLLAQLSSGGAYPAGAVALFRRTESEEGAPVWKPVALTAGSGDGEAHPLRVDGEPFTVHGTGEPPTVEAQLLTVTSEGVWVDGERQDAHVSATLFFKAEGEAGGHVAAGWCTIAGGDEPACDHELPEELPTGPSRSYAWAAAGEPYGTRVTSGFREGVTLRLQGSTFKRVLGLGGSPSREPGAAYGAAFSSPTEGWLGEGQLPVHLTAEPEASLLTPWPVSFRHALLAVAPEPGAPIGASTSSALAVGDQGEVARYEPGQGWVPEALRSAGGKVETPRLRAVAWPEPDRAFAVGDGGAMWMWQAQTGVWEPDPAAIEVTANLMGIAFDPGEPQRGYAVGLGGTLLGYGKTWTQEPLPAEVQGASFTSIAFAGSEAIVAWRKLLDTTRRSGYVGGLLINDGSGWQVDQEAAAVLGSATKVPELVAALPDGGAAFVAESFGPDEGGARLYVKESPSAHWEASGAPIPGGSAPGALSIFREGEAIRAVIAGSAPDSFAVEGTSPTPPGFPPPEQGAYPLSTTTGLGVLRETATGWRDEQHELNDVTEPQGRYSFYDTVYEPDPIRAVLISPDGTAGWAVGGAVDTEDAEGVLDTADVERYPADGTTPIGEGTAPITTEAGEATFAIGGNAQCAAPCADRANARIGPDAWLSAALQRAGQISGVRAFLYTGPRVTTGETNGPPTLAVPYAGELSRYAQLLGSSPLPAYGAVSPYELDGSHSECTLEDVFGGFPSEPVESRSEEPCTGQAGYYSFDSSGAGGTVNVIVLDDSSDVGERQLGWLTARLVADQASLTPSIVVGNADLDEQIGAGDAAAAAVAAALVNHNASAYFYDSPEENVQETLRVGSASIPAFGSGTLGYVNFLAERTGHFLGASGFLLASIDVAAREGGSNRVPVTVRLIPNIGELALEADSGTLLQRSHAALFQALARRPRSGNRSPGGSAQRPDTDPYIPIPSNCIGSICASGIFPEYEFTSSRPEIGNFVEHNDTSSEATAVLLQGGKPVSDPRSGLFCAYNAGTTIVTISAGGLSASLPVTVQGGSVRRPCGTQPLASKATSTAAPTPAPPPSAAPASSSPPLSLPSVPAPPGATPAAASHAVTPAVFLPALATPAQASGALLVPLPIPAPPTPPSGTSPVTSPIEVAQHEEEDEHAMEETSAAVAYRAHDESLMPYAILGLVILAAFAGVSTPRRRRTSRREAQLAYAVARVDHRVTRVLQRRRRRW